MDNVDNGCYIKLIWFLKEMMFICFLSVRIKSCLFFGLVLRMFWMCFFLKCFVGCKFVFYCIEDKRKKGFFYMS